MRLGEKVDAHSLVCSCVRRHIRLLELLLASNTTHFNQNFEDYVFSTACMDLPMGLKRAAGHKVVA